MSFSIDANILLYASDTSSDRNKKAVSFLQKCASGSEAFYLAWPTVMAYLRIATHPKIFTNPLSPTDAHHNMAQLLSLSHCRVVDAGADFWANYKSLAAEYHPSGNLVPDLYLAAILKQNGIKRLYTCDRDFRRFEFLDVLDPTR